MLKVTTAKDVMRRDLVTLDPGVKILTGVERLLKHNISGAPVVDSQKNYLGVFSEKCSINALTHAIEIASEIGLDRGTAYKVMVSDLVTLSPEMDVFEAIDHVLRRRISGAPVVDEDRNFLGIFSEKTAMRVLIYAAYDHLPGTKVASYMNTDRNRIVPQDACLLDVARRFQQTPYRRLPVLMGTVLAGQISRRDLLRAAFALAKQIAEKAKADPSNELLSSAQTDAPVEAYQDRHAITINPEEDLLGIAQIFLNSPYRRLPVVENGRLLGQVSRRDLLNAAAELLRPSAVRSKPATLYLSQLNETAPSSIQ